MRAQPPAPFQGPLTLRQRNHACAIPTPYKGKRDEQNVHPSPHASGYSPDLATGRAHAACGLLGALLSLPPGKLPLSILALKIGEHGRIKAPGQRFDGLIWRIVLVVFYQSADPQKILFTRMTALRLRNKKNAPRISVWARKGLLWQTCR